MDILKEAKGLSSVRMIYVECGEPFLYYPVMIETLKPARSMEFDTRLVANAYWASGSDYSELWLKTLSNLGLKDFSLSASLFHHRDLDAE